MNKLKSIMIHFTTSYILASKLNKKFQNHHRLHNI